MYAYGRNIRLGAMYLIVGIVLPVLFFTVGPSKIAFVHNLISAICGLGFVGVILACITCVLSSPRPYDLAAYPLGYLLTLYGFVHGTKNSDILLFLAIGTIALMLAGECDDWYKARKRVA